MKSEQPMITSSSTAEKAPISAERERSLERRTQALLICPDNDPESRMIQLLAKHMSMSVLSSKQFHGAKLEKEEGIVDKVSDVGKPEVWIVEIPGPEIEQELRKRGFEVHLIDHHTYGELDRVTDSASHERKRSSLEQFIAEADVTDEELREWGYDPRIVKGLGILDDRFAEGLREDGYAQEEITRVVDFSTAFSREMNPVFDEIQKAAEEDWKHREDWNGYILIRSTSNRDVRGAIGYQALREGLDHVPAIISSCGGKKIFLQNADPEDVKLLQKEIPPTNTFTFGSGRCWGYDSRGGVPTVTLDQVLRKLIRG